MIARTSLGFTLAIAVSAAALAQTPEACGKFKWSLDRELALIAAGPAPAASGASISIADKAFRVALTPGADAGFTVAPERPPQAGTSAASLTLTVATAGLYQITLSDEGWIDVAQGGQRVKSAAFSGQKGCPGVRKSVRFPLQAGATILEISNVAGDAIDLAIETAN